VRPALIGDFEDALHLAEARDGEGVIVVELVPVRPARRPARQRPGRAPAAARACVLRVWAGAHCSAAALAMSGLWNSMKAKPLDCLSSIGMYTPL